MAELFEITELDDADTQRLVLHGELDIANAQRLEDRLMQLREEGRPVELDLSQLEFIDSTGLAVLIRATAPDERSGAAASIGALSGSAMRVIELAGLTERLGLAKHEEA